MHTDEGTLQRAPQDDVLAKISYIYDCNQQRYAARRQQMALRHRRRLIRARASFQQELNQALQPQMQQGLGVTVCLDADYRSRPGFIAQFEFEGQHWVLTCRPKVWGCDWFFKRSDLTTVVRCSRHTLERELCDALGRHHHHIASRHSWVA
jgi:hypothetical protein